ncbi:MAG: primary replicative helicase [Acidobacteriales bacterium]|nr:primary replicative helicase [Terriglobales bacterium]
MATLDQSLDRGLPASVDAERTILGAILLDNSSCNEAAESIRPDDFYLDAHRRIFSRMMELNERGAAIDIITLTEELGRKKEVESVGGVAYISSLIDGVPHQPSIEQYVKIVKDKSLLRNLIHASNNAIARALEQSDTAAEIIDSAESAIFQIAEDRINQGFVGIPQIVKDSFGSIDNLYQRGQRITGLETHYDKLDEMTSGLQPSDLVIIAARPSMGKTAFAINIAENAAVMDGKCVAVFSLEMSRESLVLRMLCSQSRVDSHKLRTGFLSRDDFGKLTSGLESLAQAPIFIDDTPGISLSEMRAKVRRLQQSQKRLDMIIVDYLQLMSAAPPGGGKRYENRTQEVSAISRGLKALAKEMRVPVVALSQLSRAPEGRTGNNRPQLSDLRESGAIEQDADVVAFIFREEVYKQDDPELEGLAEIIIAKQRNGPTGTIKMAFIKKSTRFENMAGDIGPAGDDY